VLKNKNKLPNSDKFKQIKLFTDRTLIQRERIKLILDGLNQRKSIGETNLYIKHNNNVPVVWKNARNYVQMPIS